MSLTAPDAKTNRNNNQRIAQSAEQLMRSRYSAFCSADIDYLIASHHPSKTLADDRAVLAETIALCQWLKLEIVNSCQEVDHQSTVEFIAHYMQDGQLQQLRERSYFVKENGYWLYLEGDIIAQADSNPKKIGRNNPCWCSSGKKFKHCHG